ncbi:alpha/beta hydrolase [Leptospira sp. 96542]|nr:alpha/beta hydrolase [Leptospira sp. 96542]
MKLKNGIYYETFGNKQNTHIVLIHPAAVDSKIWKNLAQSLSEQYFIVIYDLRYHGNSIHDTDYKNDEHVNDLYSLVFHLNLQNPIICGFSMGGIIAQKYSEIYSPNLVILIGSPTYSILPNFNFIRYLSKLLINNLILFFWPGSLKYLINALFKSFNDELKKYILKIAIKNGKYSFLKDVELIIDFNGANISNKTRVVCVIGEFDDKRVFKHAIFMQDKKKSEIITIKNAYHVPHIENENLFKNKFKEIIGKYA